MSETGYEAPMRRALELAESGPARGINPRVGCVILDPDGRVLSEGWHRGAGTAHAECDALSRLTPEQARGCTVVVTLEPCNHTGLTGPCSQLLIDAEVGLVVYAVADPGQLSRGGARRLESAGIPTVAGVLAGEVTAFLYDWLTAARLGRPFVTLKWASSLDGRIAAADGTSRWITGSKARQRVHEQREASDAIAVGIGTVLADDPSLTARDEAGCLLPEQPIPVVFGSRAIPEDAAVLRHPQRPLVFADHDLTAALAQLRQRGIRRLFVEGGPTLASAFVRAGLVDEYLIYLAPMLLGGGRSALDDVGVTTLGERQELRLVSLRQLGQDLLVVAVPESGSGLVITESDEASEDSGCAAHHTEPGAGTGGTATQPDTDTPDTGTNTGATDTDTTNTNTGTNTEEA